MQDRVPRYPGRVKLVPVSGQENVFDLVRADQPTQDGTPLSKATLLKDSTAALYGLGTGAVPDEVLCKIKSMIDINTAAVAARARIAVGSYAGTGTYGSGNPNNLTFDFEPKMLFIFSKTPDASNTNVAKFGREESYWLYNSGVFFPEQSTFSYNTFVRTSNYGKTISWYSDRNVYSQMNDESRTYYYVAIG